jgi:hypothetical protein
MSGLFYKTVSALCYDVARVHAACAEKRPYNDVTIYVLDTWHAMPRFLAWPIRILTLVFAWSAVFTTGSLYHQLSPERRLARLEAWRHARVGVRRDLIRFYMSLGALAYYQRETSTSGAPVLQEARTR